MGKGVDTDVLMRIDCSQDPQCLDADGPFSFLLVKEQAVEGGAAATDEEVAYLARIGNQTRVMSFTDFRNKLRVFAQQQVDETNFIGVGAGEMRGQDVAVDWLPKPNIPLRIAFGRDRPETPEEQESAIEALTAALRSHLHVKLAQEVVPETRSA